MILISYGLSRPPYNSACIARNFCMSEQQVHNLLTGTESLKPCISETDKCITSFDQIIKSLIHSIIFSYVFTFLEAPNLQFIFTE